MNKFKHVTPTNIAPLGKRLNNIQAGEKNKLNPYKWDFNLNKFIVTRYQKERRKQRK